jgi:hypothetical protein
MLEMFTGLVGRIVETFGPHTEASDAAIAVQFIVAFGNAVGRGPRVYVGQTPHHMNEFLAVVGRTSRARKGDSKNAALFPLQEADPEWASNIASGLSSGEGLINAVRDPGDDHEGADDKRLLVVETEFATAIKQFSREGNILSATLRDAWDGKDTLRVLTKNNPLKATDAHISVIAHTTPEELHKYLANVEAANGLGNRFQFALIDRAKLLPRPGSADSSAVSALVATVRDVLAAARDVRVMRFTPAAEALWDAVYPSLTADHPGLIGSLLARSEAHVLRLSALFALCARSSGEIDEEHLRSALAFFHYIDESTKRIFAERSGNDTADRIRDGLTVGQSMTLTEIRSRLFSNRVTANALEAALQHLAAEGLVGVTKNETGGRPEVLVTRTDPATRADSEPAEPQRTEGGDDSEAAA